jgi:hypothetical protein
MATQLNLWMPLWHYTKNQEGTEMRTDIDHWLAIFPLGCCPPKNLLPKGKMPKRNSPLRGTLIIDHTVKACPLGSWGIPSTPPDVAKGWHVWHLAILFYVPFMVRMFTLGNATKKSSCHMSSGIRRCCPLNSWRKQRQNQSIHTYLIIWVWIIPFMYQVDDAMSHMVTRESWPHSPNPYACPVCCRDVASVAPDRKAWCRDM